MRSLCFLAGPRGLWSKEHGRIRGRARGLLAVRESSLHRLVLISKAAQTTEEWDAFGQNSRRKRNGMACSFRPLRSKGRKKLRKTTQQAEWRGWRAPNCPSGRKLQSGSQKLEGSAREMCDWEHKPLPHLFIPLFNHYLSNPYYPCFVHCCSLSTYKGYSHEQSPGLPGVYILVGKTEKQSINQIIFCWMLIRFMEKKQERRRQRVAGAEEVAI